MAKTNPPPEIIRIKLSLLHPSPGNREFGTGMDKKSLTELAATIKEHGVKQALLVRPHPDKKGHFEIVFGNRRRASSEIAEVPDAPCMVENLSDSVAQELRLIENVQRVGIHEMEEARDYQRLLELKDEKTGLLLHTKATIAEKIGKSEAYVYARIKLLRMPDVAQEAFLSRKLNASIALLLCRIPDPKMAHKATLEVLDRYGSGITAEREKRALDPECDPMSYRDAKQHIQNKYMKRLKGAKFDPEDETLVPVVYEELNVPGGILPPPGSADVPPAGKGDVEDFKTRAAARAAAVASLQGERLCGGKCSDCPFLTGNMKKLAPDIVKSLDGSTDVCTNTACYQLKEKATVKREQAKFKDKGQTLLSENQAQRILNHDGSAVRSSEYIDLRAAAPGKKGKTWEEVLEPHLPEGTTPMVARGKKNFLVLPVEAAMEAAHKAGVKLEKPEARSDGDYKKEEEKREKTRAFAKLVVAESVKQLTAAAQEKKNAKLVRDIIGTELLSRQLREEEPKKVYAKVEKLSDAELFVTLFNHLIFPHGLLDYQGEIDETLAEVCSEFAVDVKAITVDIGKQQKEAERAADIPPASAKPKDKPDKK